MYVDMDYAPDGSLVVRRGQFSHQVDPRATAEKVVKFLDSGKVVTTAGTDLEISAKSVCVHGDTRNAVDSLRVIREELKSQGVEVTSIRNIAQADGSKHISAFQMTGANMMTTAESVIEAVPAKEGRPSVTYRFSGDEYLLIEFGDMTTDFFYNLRAMGLGERAKKIPGVIETVPAMRSLLVHFDSLQIGMKELLAKLKEIEESVESVSDLVIPSRLLRLPVAYRDKHTTEFIGRYAKLIRPDAPNIMDGHNIGYVAKYNGVSIEEMIRLIGSNQYWVAMLGFWPGLAFMTPLDMRAYLTAPKYNPTRPWTPEGAFGIGGPIVAIYPIESPGGYQLLGRSIPIYDLKQRNPVFRKNPVLFQPADRIEWETVTDDELEELRKQVFDGTYRYRLYPYESFNVKKYLEFLEDTKEEARAFAARAEEARKGIAFP